jgi:hypothetical protein
MHPGVGPSCAHDRLADSATQAGQRGLELSLDGPGPRLSLKTRELRAVVFNRGPEPPLGRSPTSCPLGHR